MLTGTSKLSAISAEAPKSLPHIVDMTMFWADEGGGVRRYLTAKHEFLKAEGTCRHTIVTPGKLSAVTPEVPGMPLPFAPGYRIPLSQYSSMKVLMELKPDLIEAGDPYRFAWTALKLSGEFGVPAVAFYHSDLPELAMRAFGRAGQRAATAYARKLYTRFDVVLAPSRYAVERLESFGVTRALLQPLGVDTSLFHPSRRDPDWRLEAIGANTDRIGKSSREPFVALYVGRYAPEKNLAVLTAAADRLGGELILVTIGGGPSPPPAGPNVHVRPFESNPYALARAIASADIFVHAGDQETFGLAALEAMACGVPVVSCASGGLGELVDEHVGFAVPHCNADEFGEALHALFTRDRAALGRAARARALRYQWSAVLPGLLMQYRKLLGNSTYGAGGLRLASDRSPSLLPPSKAA